MRNIRVTYTVVLFLFAYSLIVLFLAERSFAEETTCVYATKNFRTEVFHQCKVPKEKESVLEYLRRSTAVETSFGGQFVTALSGVPVNGGSPNESWFFYVNGILSQVGAAAYIVQPGDVVLWDYHPWSYRSFVPAIIGAYPQPFLSGYAGKRFPTEIIFSENGKTIAARIKKSLQAKGVDNLTLSELDSRFQNDNCDVLRVVVGPWSEINDVPFVAERYRNGRKSGIWFRFDEELRVTIQTFSGEAGREIPHAGIIAASSFMQRACFVLFVIGSRLDDVRRASRVLLTKPETLSIMAQAIVLKNGEVIHAPVF